MFFFFRKTPKGGGEGVSPNPKFSNQKKMKFFWNFFLKGGGSHLFQKGVIIKEWRFWNIFVKRGVFIQSIEILSKKN